MSPVEQNRRQEAQAAMEDESHRAAREVEAEKVAKRRREAMRAMEGEIWRKRREAVESEGKRAAATEAAANQSVAAKALAERQAKIDQEQKLQSDLAAKKASEERRLDDIDYSEKLIDKLKTQGLAISPLRTLKTDMARAVKEEGISVAKVALAQQAKTRSQGATAKPATRPKSHLGSLVLILVLVLAGAGGFVWWQSYAPNQGSALPPSTAPTALIFAEESQELILPTTPSSADLREAIRGASSAGSWQVKQLYPATTGVALKWNQARARLGLTLPDTLARSLEEGYMFGLIKQGNSASPFLLLKTKFYNNAAAGLREWEKTMPQSLFPLFHPQNPSIASPVFSDRLIRNKDGRRLVASDGQTVIFYAFLDNETILLTTNEGSFSDIFSRYLSTQ